MKKLLSIFCMSLFMMSMTSNDDTNLDEQRPCHDTASISANNFCCDYYGEDYTLTQYNLVFAAFTQFLC